MSKRRDEEIRMFKAALRLAYLGGEAIPDEATENGFLRIVVYPLQGPPLVFPRMDVASLWLFGYTSCLRDLGKALDYS